MSEKFRGMHAGNKPRDNRGYFIECEQAPNGEWLKAEPGATTSDGKYTICDCGNVAKVVSSTDLITRVECPCSQADSGCRVLAE